MLLADLHIHSSYSRATSREADAPHLDLWARNKGLALIGTGDFTHPAWRQTLREELEQAEDGLYVLKKELCLPSDAAGAAERTRFAVSGEISSIYKKNGKTRKVHNVILLPSLEAADALSLRLERIGNIRSDGRPILGLDSRDLLDLTLTVCPDAIFIPAHIWTPHFSLFGAFSGFDTVEECFEDLSGEIHAVETGLSSDPPMNWRISALDRFTLVSNSDAHSPGKLGREANLLDISLGYRSLKRALETGEGFAGTLEFYPEEGKYHLDGHRACGISLTPEEWKHLDGRCPVCGSRLTVGVQHRAWELSDRPEGARPASAKPFESIVPLPEVIAASLGTSAASKSVQQLYFRMLRELGNEFSILREVPLAQIGHVAGPCVELGISRVREGHVLLEGGYDGVYGTVRLFEAEEREELLGQMALFGMAVPKRAIGKHDPEKQAKKETKTGAPKRTRDALNEAQQRAVTSEARALAVIAGPGTGKTKTLVSRIEYLVKVRKADPSKITAVTFTHQAAEEMRERLSARLGKKTAECLTVGTFHAVCLFLLDKRPLVGRAEALPLMREALQNASLQMDASEALDAVSVLKCSGVKSDREEALLAAYRAVTTAHGVRDLDDLLLDALTSDAPLPVCFSHLLVDEYQDINALQRQLVLKWSAEGESLFVIGDADQSIYGFRGASASCFADLVQARPELCTVTLQQNYRSTPEILEAALSVIDRNSGGTRTLRAMRPSGVPVRTVRANDAFAEAVWIAKEIARLTGGVDMLSAETADAPIRAFSDIAVLVRTHRQLTRIEECLLHDGIPCAISGRDDAYSDEAVRGAVAFFRFLSAGSADDLAACLMLSYGVAEREALQIATCAGRTEARDADALLAAGCPAAIASDVCAFLPLLSSEPPRKLLERFAANPGRVGRSHREAYRRLTDTAAFHAHLVDFLRMLTLGEEADLCRAGGKAYASGAVRLMTLHASKGLEFPVVFLIGLQEDVLPLTHAGQVADIEEERRLFFVGMTRARDELILTVSGKDSPFVTELPGSIRFLRAADQRCMADSRQLKLF